MCVKDVVIQNQVGLHARPATFFIQKANEYKSSIWVEKEDRKVNAKSLLGVLSLGIVGGTAIKIIVDGSDEKVFSKKEMNNQLNLHALRAECARNYYFDLLRKVQEEPTFREELEKEVRLRWELYNIDKKTGKPKPFDEKLITGEYVFKGKNRILAIRKGRPVRMDKLCLLATSMMKLSHYRLSVAAVSYMLA